MLFPSNREKYRGGVEREDEGGRREEEKEKQGGRRSVGPRLNIFP